MSIEERVRKVVAEQFGVELSRVTNEDSLKDTHQADSLDLLELTMSIEDEFGIEIPDEDIQPKFTKVQSIIDYVRPQVVVAA